MKKLINAKYAVISEDLKLIRLLENPPRANGLMTILEDVAIEINESILKIDGNEWIWGFAFEKTFVNDLDNKPITNHTFLGYESILDYFKKIKKPYVKFGWYRLEKTKPYKAEMSQWFLEL